MRKDPKTIFKQYLKATDRNVTEARKKIVEEVFNLHGHFDAFDLWARLRSETNISISTIYRTLDLLNNAGLVKEVNLGQPQTYYEHVFGEGEHGHLICLSCGAIIEFSNQEIEESLREIEERHEFSREMYNLQVFGLCSKCSRDRDRSR